MNKLCISLLGAAVVCLVPASPSKADLFVSGDSNVIDPLTGIHNGVPGIDTGNQQFFRNILGGGNSVAVLQSGTAYGSLFVSDVNQFYNGISGKSSTVIAGTISSLAGYNLLVAPLPDHAFTSSEITVLKNFLNGGNSIFFLGENNDGVFTAANANITSDLAALGSSMQIVPNLFDSDWHTATGSHIATNPYTSGVSHLSYAAPSSVSGGNYLYFGTGGQPMITYAAVPEPSSLALIGCGLLAVFGVGRKSRKCTDRRGRFGIRV
jgi:hypothetical protein